ncbi:hypothetical protein D5F01_LYC16947 [Larimichthys crocea]|uniref:Uncharacterized protein n=1 Tax=Larimichthys crocea TaxID=215358 RepID=A0A6G0I238_LARCR|nr:hypothetical protein D5F01_LYC16947 [Larimichthys crocea]
MSVDYLGSLRTDLRSKRSPGSTERHPQLELLGNLPGEDRTKKHRCFADQPEERVLTDGLNRWTETRTRGSQRAQSSLSVSVFGELQLGLFDGAGSCFRARSWSPVHGLLWSRGPVYFTRQRLVERVGASCHVRRKSVSTATLGASSLGLKAEKL